MAFEPALDEVEGLTLRRIAADPASQQQQDKLAIATLAHLPLSQATGHASPEEARRLEADLFLLSDNPALRLLALQDFGYVEADEEAAEEQDETNNDRLQTLKLEANKFDTPVGRSLARVENEIASHKSNKALNTVDNLLSVAGHDPEPALQIPALRIAGAMMEKKQEATAEQMSRIAMLSSDESRPALARVATRVIQSVAGYMSAKNTDVLAPVRHAETLHVSSAQIPQDQLA